MITSPAQVLPKAAAQFGDKEALVASTRSFTFNELNEMSNRLAAEMTARGFQPGRTISLYSQNRWEWLVAYHAALKAGAVVNPINVMLTGKEVEFVLNDCEAAVIFTGEAELPKVLEATSNLKHECLMVNFGEAAGEVRAFADLLDTEHPYSEVEVDPTTPSTIGYTSGTTGHPKGAVQSHTAVAANFGLSATMHARDDRDVIVTALPAPHVYGNVAINSTWLVGGKVVLMERFNPAEALQLIHHHRATMFEGVPAMYSMMLAEDSVKDTDFSGIRRCTVGGQTMAISTMEAWEKYSGAPLIELWGMTELAGLGTTHARHFLGPKGSIGVPLPGVEAMIGDLSDPTTAAEPGQPGELLIRGPIVMSEYYGNPESTKEVFLPGGWLRTGDVARRDEQGFIFIVDRLKDLILTGGYNVYPAEIERVLSAHPQVALAAVGPVPDEVKGELACAYVVRKNGSTVDEAELIEFSSQHLAPYKRPRMVRFVDDVPKTSSGKIMRRKLAEAYAASSGTQDSPMQKVGVRS